MKIIKIKPIKMNKKEYASEEELKAVTGMGNRIGRYYPDEFIQSKVLKEGRAK